MKKNYHFCCSLTRNRTFFLLVLFMFAIRTTGFSSVQSPVIVSQPYNRTICENANAYFTIKAVNVDSYLWEVSTDGAVTWTPATGGIYTGGTTDTLKLKSAYQMAQYRCIVDGAGVKETSAVASLGFFIVEQTLKAKSTQVCRNDSTTITLASSQTGVSYYLRDGSTVKGPMAGTGNPLTFNTGPIYSTRTFSILAQKSALGSALMFDGVDDYVKVEKGLGELANFTFSTFVFPSDLTNGKIFSNNQYELTVSGGSVSFKTSTLGTVSYNSITKDAWSHLAVSYDGTTLRLYLNGTEVNSVAATGSLPAATSFTLGKDAATACCYFSGKLDELRVRNKCLSQAEIRASMTDCLDGTESDLVGYFRFDDGVGSPFLSDVSRHGLNGTLMGMDNSAAWVLGTSTCGDNLACSKVMQQTVKITVYALVPTVTVIPASRCDKGTVMLGASTSEGSLSWFNTPSGGNPIATGTSFTTPYLTATTTYYVSASEQGCTSSRKEVTATVKPLPDVNVTSNAATITVTANQPGATYQWLDCKKEFLSILGATSNPYVATVSGSYAVGITLDGCKDTSRCVSVTIATGINDEAISNQLLVFPNPSNGSITIRATLGGNYLLVNELGQTIQTLWLNGSNNYTTTIDNLRNGMYMLIGTADQQAWKQKIIITR